MEDLAGAPLSSSCLGQLPYRTGLLDQLRQAFRSVLFRITGLRAGDSGPTKAGGLGPRRAPQPAPAFLLAGAGPCLPSCSSPDPVPRPRPSSNAVLHGPGNLLVRSDLPWGELLSKATFQCSARMALAESFCLQLVWAPVDKD